jgi:hypothetical protein
MNKTIATTAVISGVSGVVLGGVVTYVTVNKRLVKRYEDWANEEIASVKARYALMRKDTEGLDILQESQNPSPEVQAAVEAGRKIIEAMRYAPDLEETAPVEKEEEADDRFPGSRSIFDQAVHPSEYEPSDEPDDEDVFAGEDGSDGAPFLITEAAYFENEHQYQLDTLTYYAVDDTLADEHNNQIEEIEATVGGKHLHMFETAGKDKKTSIYVQNDTHETLYEIILIEGRYAVIVLGMDESLLEESESPRKRKQQKMKKDAD